MNGTKQLNQHFESHGHWSSFSIYEGGLRLEVFSEIFEENISLHLSWRRDFTVKSKIVHILPGMTTLNFRSKNKKINYVELCLESVGAEMFPSNIFEQTDKGLLFKRIFIQSCDFSVPTLQMLCRLRTPIAQRNHRLFNIHFPKRFVNIKV